MKNILAIVFLTLIVSCDGPYNNCPEYYFSDYYKSYTNFHENSYWIYRDTLYDKIDSIVILTQNIQFNDNCDYNTDSEEIIEQHLSSSFFNENSSEFKIFGYASMKVYNSGFEIPTGYFIDNVDVIGQANFIDSLEVNGYWYKNIRFFKSDKYESYWAEDVGLIKKVFPYPSDSDTIYHFDIIKYHIE